MLGMATEPRQKTDPNKSFSDVEDAFNRLAAILQQHIATWQTAAQVRTTM